MCRGKFALRNLHPINLRLTSDKQVRNVLELRYTRNAKNRDNTLQSAEERDKFKKDWGRFKTLGGVEIGIESFGAAVGRLAEHGDLKAVYGKLNEMKAHGHCTSQLPKHPTLKLISLLGRKGRTDEAVQIAKNSPFKDIEMYNTLTTITKSRNAPEVIEIFDGTLPSPDKVTFSILMGLAKSQHELGELGTEMTKANLDFEMHHYEAMLKCLSRCKGKLQTAEHIWKVAKGSKYPVLANFMLVFLRNTKNWQRYDSFFAEFPKKQRSAVTYTVTIDCFKERQAESSSPFMQNYFVEQGERIHQEALSRRSVQQSTWVAMMSLYTSPPRPEKALDLYFTLLLSDTPDCYPFREQFKKATAGFPSLPPWVPRKVATPKEHKDFREKHKKAKLMKDTWVQENRPRVSKAFTAMTNYLY
eukprot:TRINITY_DN4786_c4_g1_i1.p1 TRINITY_DN4786_c4_g1~~TRINITY_DN4786_c4_g1_i1.p1  ORF type:complete len:431 (+),score=77.46 TRINITY_DN4786_c4_g1_i1:49-1293(+)